MLSRNAPAIPVKAKLLVDTVVDSVSHAAGEIVELSAREFRYLSNLDRVEAAPAPKGK